MYLNKILIHTKKSACYLFIYKINQLLVISVQIWLIVIMSSTLQ